MWPGEEGGVLLSLSMPSRFYYSGGGRDTDLLGRHMIKQSPHFEFLYIALIHQNKLGFLLVCQPSLLTSLDSLLEPSQQILVLVLQSPGLVVLSDLNIHTKASQSH